MNNCPRLIVFEGPDAAGKSTICTHFTQALQKQGVAARSLSFPGKVEGTIGELVYRIHHAPTAFGVQCLTASSLQALHIAAHLDAIEVVIRPALELGETIVLDRYWWSTWVYGIVGGASPEVLDALIEAERIALGKWQPATLFYVTRQAPLRDEPLEQWNRLKTAYSQLVNRETGRYPIHTIENEDAAEVVTERALRLSSI